MIPTNAAEEDLIPATKDATKKYQRTGIYMFRQILFFERSPAAGQSREVTLMYVLDRLEQ